MQWLFYTIESDKRASVSLIYNVEPSNFDMYDGYIEVDNIPEPEHKKGYSNILYVNPKTEEIWYEYTEKELTEEEKLVQRLAVAEEMLMQLMLEGGA